MAFISYFLDLLSTRNCSNESIDNSEMVPETISLAAAENTPTVHLKTDLIDILKSLLLEIILSLLTSVIPTLDTICCLLSLSTAPKGPRHGHRQSGLGYHGYQGFHSSSGSINSSGFHISSSCGDPQPSSSSH